MDELKQALREVIREELEPIKQELSTLNNKVDNLQKQIDLVVLRTKKVEDMFNPEKLKA